MVHPQTREIAFFDAEKLVFQKKKEKIVDTQKKTSFAPAHTLYMQRSGSHFGPILR